ncbi:hypothetical protein B4N89_01415 [Embleya scabrispora]|uniref:Uncharacterized protein n=1 Tax=Embleya scabrispora TaxID=159449 RepID=A0A1T3NSX0_9ACTN|nr:hypothetical protein [Embleya scabrispora]OPC79780.1 hypothetical protein B4N89_01415 [Embleya scabrispora]
MARDPYAWGDPIRGDRDRRSAALGGVIAEYEISAGILTVTMPKVVGIRTRTRLVNDDQPPARPRPGRMAGACSTVCAGYRAPPR